MMPRTTGNASYGVNTYLRASVFTECLDKHLNGKVENLGCFNNESNPHERKNHTFLLKSSSKMKNLLFCSIIKRKNVVLMHGQSLGI